MTFDIKRANQLIATGTHFWCEACLVARPLDDQSPDPRYCQGCYDFLLKEAEMLTGHTKKADWIPIKPKQTGKTLSPVPTYGGGVLAAMTAERAKTQPRVDKGGRPKMDLPIDLIRELQERGLGATEIKRQLADRGIIVSMRTLYRILSGQRLLV